MVPLQWFPPLFWKCFYYLKRGMWGWLTIKQGQWERDPLKLPAITYYYFWRESQTSTALSLQMLFNCGRSHYCKHLNLGRVNMVVPRPLSLFSSTSFSSDAAATISSIWRQSSTWISSKFWRHINNLGMNNFFIFGQLYILNSLRQAKVPDGGDCDKALSHLIKSLKFCKNASRSVSRLWRVRMEEGDE